MSNELQTSDLNNTKNIELLKTTIAASSKLTDGEFNLFLHVCRRTGLDPFANQIYAIKRVSKDGEKMTIQTGIDGYRLIAERTAKYMPGRPQTFEYRNGSQVFCCTAYVKKMDCKGEWHEVAHTVYMEEYGAKKYDGSLTNMWASKPHIMLGKCAEAAVLRKAFPADLSGLYTKEEMHQADNPAIESTNNPTESAPIVVEVADPVIGVEKAKILEDMLTNNQEILSKITSGYQIENLSMLKEKNYSAVYSRVKDLLIELGEIQPE